MRQIIIARVLVLVPLIVDSLGASFPWSRVSRVAKLPLPCHRVGGFIMCFGLAFPACVCNKKGVFQIGSMCLARAERW